MVWKSPDQIISDHQRRSDSIALAFVWAVWVLMIAMAAITLYSDSRNIPTGEDWFVINAYTGNEPNLWKWLWTQNLEHRTPLPRAIMLAILKVTHGQLRLIDACNLGLLGAIAAALMFTAKRLRGGHF